MTRHKIAWNRRPLIERLSITAAQALGEIYSELDQRPQINRPWRESIAKRLAACLAELEAKGGAQ